MNARDNPGSRSQNTFNFGALLLSFITVTYFVYTYINGGLLTDSAWFWGVVIFFVGYNVAPLLSRRLQFLTSPPLVSVLTIVVFAVLAIYFIPVGHPLELIGFLLVTLAAYKLSTGHFIFNLTLLVSVYVFAFIYQTLPAEVSITDFVITLSALIVNGLLLHLYSRHDQQERSRLSHLSDDMEYERIRLQSLINSMADAVIAFDRNGAIQLYNGAALGLLNTNETLSNRKLKDFITFVDGENNPVDLLSEATESLRIIKRSDLLFVNNEGESINLYVDLAPVRLQGTKIDGFILLLRDITKEKSIEEQRDDFISIVSHELRTPIAITEGNISTAMLPSIKTIKKRLELMEQAHKNILFLADLVNDITTLAHAERGDLDTPLADADPAMIAKELASNYTVSATENGLKFKVDIDKRLPQIHTNEHRLREILQDFITNAVKYTTAGSITLQVKRLDKKHVRFSVIDTGIGIGTTDRKHVFDKFYRAENYQTREHKGTGLGLYIARKLADLIGAKVGVTSKLNQGSEFYVDVPTA